MPKPRPDSEEAGASSLRGAAGPRAEVVTRELDGARAIAFDALSEGLATASRIAALALPETTGLAIPADLLLERVFPGSDLGAELRRVAEALLRSVLEREGAPPPEALEAGAEAIRGAAVALEDERVTDRDAFPWRPDRMRLLGHAEQLLRDVALESLDTDVGLAHRRGEARPALGAVALRPVAAHVRLLERVFDRLETSLLGHELLRTEREASAWWFMRWSARSRPQTVSSQAVREQEWSLVERSTLFMGPVLDNFLEEAPGRALPPRQRRLAEALLASFPGVFTVRERQGGVAVLQDTVTGRRIEVHEHNDSLDYGAGAVVLGRLYAFEGPLHLRSPGAILVGRGEAGLATALGEGFRRGKRHLPPAVALEAVLTAFGGDSDLPRPLLPARTPSDARVRVERATLVLHAAGMVDEPDPSAGPGAATEEGVEAAAVRRYRVDVPVGEWLSALFDQAQKAPSTTTPKGGAATAKRKGGGGKRRRRR